jgi:hypothetical protein
MALTDSVEPTGMRQYAPFPDALAEMIEHARYKAGWTLQLIDIERDAADTHSGSAGGLTLEVLARTDDAYSDSKRCVIHYFPVPAATYDDRSWKRWLLDCLVKIETHEACEFFRFVHLDGPDGEEAGVAERPFAPNHGPGRDPYTVFDYATDEDRRTSFRGEVKEDAAKRIAEVLTPGYVQAPGDIV